MPENIGEFEAEGPTGKRLWGQNYVFAPTENQRVVNEECLCTLKNVTPRTKIGRYLLIPMTFANGDRTIFVVKIFCLTIIKKMAVTPKALLGQMRGNARYSHREPPPSKTCLATWSGWFDYS